MKQLTIGICTVATRPESYLATTLASLLAQIDAADQAELQIVLFDCDVTPAESAIMQQVRMRFQRAIAEDLLEIVRPSAADYPAFANLPGAYGDSPARVSWRTKQCWDYSLILQYCAGRSHYYLHLEDDVLCAENFYKKIRQEVQQRPADQWSALQFCELGFIGLLFKATDLPKLAAFLRTFADEAPVDWLIEHFFDLRRRRGQAFVRTERALFQHIGYYSSLQGKISTLRSPSFDGGPARFSWRTRIMKKLVRLLSAMNMMKMWYGKA